MYYYILKKFQFFFKIDLNRLIDFKPTHIPKLKTVWDKQTILSYLLDIDDTLKNYYKLKEKYRYFNLTAEYDTCDDELDELIDEFKSNPVKEFRDFGRMLQTWKVEIKNSFIMSKDRRISNGPIESTNSKIKTIIKASNGIRDFKRLRNKIMYSINKDTPLKKLKIMNKCIVMANKRRYLHILERCGVPPYFYRPIWTKPPYYLKGLFILIVFSV